MSAEPDTGVTSRDPANLELHLGLVRAVSADAAVRHLTASNDTVTDTAGRQEYVDVEEAVRRDLPFFVTPREDVLALDFDNPDARANAEVLHVELLLDGYRPVLWDSGSGAGTYRDRRSHMFVRVEDPAERARVKERAKELGADAREGNSGIRPPLTRHASREVRSLPVYPAHPTVALRRLRAPRSPGLPQGLHALVFEEVVEKGGRSQAIFRVARTLARLGWTGEEVLLLLRQPGRAIAVTYRNAVAYRSHRGDDWFTKYVWPKAEDASWEGARHRIRQLRTLARQRPWTGRSATTERKVYEALLAQAEQAGRLTVAVSRRRLCELTGLSASPVVKAIRHLEDQGVLKKLSLREADEFRRQEERARRATGKKGDFEDERGYLTGSSVFDLSVLPVPEGTPETADETGSRSLAFKNVAGYGAGVGLTWEEIAGRDGVGMQELAAARGITLRTARAHVHILESLGLVRDTPQGRVTTEVHPDDVVPEAARLSHKDMLTRHSFDREDRRTFLEPGAS